LNLSVISYDMDALPMFDAITTLLPIGQQGFSVCRIGCTLEMVLPLVMKFM
jgi:hypothetical protein